MRGHEAGNRNTSTSVSGNSLLKIQHQHPPVWPDYGWVTQICPGLKLHLAGLFFNVVGGAGFGFFCGFFSVCFGGFSIPSPPRAHTHTQRTGVIIQMSRQ